MFSVINQPQDEALGYILEEILSRDPNSQFNIFYFLVAYAKSSGVQRLSAHMSRFRENGGQIKAIVGIDQKNTSYEALVDLYNLCDELFVFHDENFSRTYHPKLYFFESVDQAVWVSVGSSNMTGGGLYSNYEVNVTYHLNRSQDEDIAKYFELRSIFDYYSDNSTGCSFLANPDFLQSLLDNQYIYHESQLREATVRQIRTIAERRVSLFSRQNFPEPPPRTLTTQQDQRIGTVHPINVGFWKKLSRNDVSLTSSPGQIIIPIGFINFFPPLGDPIITQSGAAQSDAFFNVIFETAEGVKTKVENTRAIFYEPAPWHARPNSEIRFTFRNHEILQSLSANDILEFKKSQDPAIWFYIRQIRPTSPDYPSFQGRFSVL